MLEMNDFEREVIERLTRIESKLENVRTIKDCVKYKAELLSKIDNNDYKINNRVSKIFIAWYLALGVGGLIGVIKAIQSLL